MMMMMCLCVCVWQLGENYFANTLGNISPYLLNDPRKFDLHMKLTVKKPISVIIEGHVFFFQFKLEKRIWFDYFFLKFIIFSDSLSVLLTLRTLLSLNC